jgi:hypothetical protein
MPTRKQNCSSCGFKTYFADMGIAIFVTQWVSFLLLHLLNFSLHAPKHKYPAAFHDGIYSEQPAEDISSFSREKN